MYTIDFTTGEVIDLTVDGDYLVGTIPHLSTYMLTGSITTNPNNPKTGDHIFIYMSIFGLSIISLLGIGLYQIKRKNN